MASLFSQTLYLTALSSKLFITYRVSVFKYPVDGGTIFCPINLNNTPI